jgi:hypothetical protein
MSPRKDFFEVYGQFGHVSSKGFASPDLGFGYFASKKKIAQLGRRQSDVATKGKESYCGQKWKPVENQFTEETTASAIYMGEGKESDCHFRYRNLDIPKPFEE